MKELDKYISEGLVSGSREASGQRMIDDAKCAMLIEDLVNNGHIALKRSGFSLYKPEDHIQALQGAARMENGVVTIDLNRMGDYEVDEMTIFISRSMPKFRVRGTGETVINVHVENVMNRQMCRRVCDMFRDSYVNTIKLCKGGSIDGLELNMNDEYDCMLIYMGDSSHSAKANVINSLKINRTQGKVIDISGIAEPIKKIELDGTPGWFRMNIEEPRVLLDVLRILGDIRQEGRTYTFISNKFSKIATTFVDDPAIESALSSLLIPKGLNVGGIGEYIIELSTEAARVRINMGNTAGLGRTSIDKISLTKENGSNWKVQLK